MRRTVQSYMFTNTLGQNSIFFIENIGVNLAFGLGQKGLVNTGITAKF